jgi:hypothetical protein
MECTGFIQTPMGPLFENPNLAEMIISELENFRPTELYMQPTIHVPADYCDEEIVNGIFYVAFDHKGNRISNSFVSQGLIARSLIDLFGKRRVRKAMYAIKKHFETQGVSVNEEVRIYK